MKFHNQTKTVLFLLVALTQISIVEAQPVKKPKRKPQSVLKQQNDFVLGLHWDHFFNTKLQDRSTQNSFQAFANYIYQNEQSDQDTKVDILFGGYPDKKISYYAVPEVYGWGQSNDSTEISFQYSLGRRHQEWNQLDERLHQGIISPIFTQDQINFKQQGLLGLEGGLNQTWYAANLGFYPLFVPNQGPGYKEENGKLIFASRWGSRLPETVNISGTAKPVEYSIASYDALKIASHAGYSGSLSFLDLQKHHLTLKTSYHHTPINDIVISREAYADLSLNAHVEVAPVVRYSDKYSVDLQTSFGGSSIGLSYLKDIPQNELESNFKAVQFFDPIEGYSIYYDSPDFNLGDQNLKLAMIYARFNGGGITDYEPDGTRSSFNVSNSRLRYREPFKIEIRDIEGSFKPSLGWIYDIEQKASLLSLSASYQLMSSLSIIINADVLGTENGSDESSNAGNRTNDLFIKQHKTDDRISGELKYVF